MFTCAWNMKQMILYEMKSSYMVSPVHTGLVHFLYMNILLCLNHETNNSLLNKIYKIISSTSILNLLLKFMQPLPHTQVDWLILPHLLFYPTFKDVLSLRWVMRISDSVCFMSNLKLWKAKYFCAVADNCRPSYLNFLLRLRQSRPDEPLKHRNIGEISQQSSQILQFFILKWNMKDDMMNANIDAFISGVYIYSMKDDIMNANMTHLFQGCIFNQLFHL